MKYLILASCAVLAFLSSCTTTNTTAPEETAEDVYDVHGYIPLPTDDLAKNTKTPVKDLHIGFGVFIRKCGECHVHSLPDEISGKEWHVITPKMSWNANITDQEQAALLKYILAAKNDPNRPKKLN